MTGEGIGSASQLGSGVDGSVSQGERVGRGGIPSGSRRVGISRLRWGYHVL